MECSTAELFLHGVTDTCSLLDVHFFTAKVFWGDMYVSKTFYVTKSNMYRRALYMDTPPTLKEFIT